MTREQQKFYDIKNTSDYKTVGEDIDYKVFTDEEHKEVVLQFEESDSREDWKHNLQFLPWPLRLENRIVWTTRGYACAYKSAGGIPLLEWFSEYMKHSEPDYKLCIRGWSFGSAMAKIAARHFIAMSGFKTWDVLDELTTYGDVKCWLNPFYKAKQIKRVREYATPNDGITWCIPFFFREKKCKVGPRFSLREIFKAEYYHTHYEDYDYSKWEES